MGFTLVIGNKNYSSWSLRPWIAMKATGIAFEEKLIPLYRDDYKQQLLSISPGGKVPVLLDGETAVWESLAILEHLGERAPSANLWPVDLRVKAHARSIAAEMHGGFAALRNECPMNMWRPVRARALSAEAQANVGRIDAMWTDCRRRYGADGPFLFGSFGAADAMYAPVVSRFGTYDVPVSAASRAYMEAVMALPAYVEWKAAGIQEPWVLQEDEPDWPTVLKA